MIRRQTRSTRTDTLFPETKRFRSCRGACRSNAPCGADRPTKALRHDIRLTYRSSMSKLPPLAAIRAFESAGRLENFSRAAEELRSEEHTSELQSLMRISYAVFCLKKKNDNTHDFI